MNSDSLDFYNEDLVWILDRLVARSGGRFGLVCRHIQGESAPLIIAQSSDPPAAVAQFSSKLADFAHGEFAFAASRTANLGGVRQALWTPTSSASIPAPLRLMILQFSPTQNVKLTACVGRDADTGEYDAVHTLAAAALHPVLERYYPPLVAISHGTQAS